MSGLQNFEEDLAITTIILEDAIDDEVIEVVLDELASLSDEEATPWGGSPPGKSPNKERDFAGAYVQLMKDYFSGMDSVFDENDFRRHFRLTRDMFGRINDAMLGEGHFKQ